MFRSALLSAADYRPAARARRSHAVPRRLRATFPLAPAARAVAPLLAAVLLILPTGAAAHDSKDRTNIGPVALGGAVRPVAVAAQRAELVRTITTFAGSGEQGFAGDGGPATDAALYWPFRVAVGADGRVFIADSYNHRVRVVSADGLITTLAGTGEPGGAGDGGPAVDAELDEPLGLASGEDGRVYIADSGNNCIRVVDPEGTIWTVAGNGRPEYTGDGGPATGAGLRHPEDVALGPGGELVIADTYNNRLRRVDRDGTIVTLAGQGDVFGVSGCGPEAGSSNPVCFTAEDGKAATARFSSPTGVAVGADGSVFVVDMRNQRIHRISTDGEIATIAGNGQRCQPPQPCFAGDGGWAVDAQLGYPVAIAIGPDGTLFIGDSYNDRVRKVTPDGVMVTIAGTGGSGYCCDDGAAARATLDNPHGVAVAPDGGVYVADAHHNRIRRVSPLQVADPEGAAPLSVSPESGPPTPPPIPTPWPTYTPVPTRPPFPTRALSSTPTPPAAVPGRPDARS